MTSPTLAALVAAWRTHGAAVTASCCVMACTEARPARGVASEHDPGSRPAASSPCRTKLLAGHDNRGVLFGAECGPAVPTRAQRAAREAVVGYWEPTNDVIGAIEFNLRRALERERSKFQEMARAPGADEASVEWARAANWAVDDILGHYSGYRRQFLGIVVTDGMRRVLVNNFPEASNGAPDEFPNWLRTWVEVDDGGPGFWRIEYDVGTGSFLGFDVNASA